MQSKIAFGTKEAILKLQKIRLEKGLLFMLDLDLLNNDKFI
jgi:hypothetical protein